MKRGICGVAKFENMIQEETVSCRYHMIHNKTISGDYSMIQDETASGDRNMTTGQNGIRQL